MSDEYYRLVTILVNICPGPLRELFLKHAMTDPNLPAKYTTLDAYLAFRKKDIMKLKSKKLLWQDQINLLFPSQNQSDIATWDLTLLTLMLTEMFKPQLSVQPTDLANINDIREIRNNLQHISGTCQITQKEFENIYQQLLSSAVQIALSAKGQTYADKIKQDIDSVANGVLVDLRDVLRQWYTNEINKLKDEIEQLKDELSNIKEDTAETRKTLKKTTEKRKQRGGKIAKRFRTVDHILDNMRGSFTSLMKHELQRDIQTPPETTRIKRELEEHHQVVVSGYGKGLYLQTALYVIDSLEYEDDRCVLVSSPSDWRHIGAEDADLVLFLHPFGKTTFDNDKAKSMNGVLDSIRSSASANEEDDIIDVVIITDQSILDECKKHFTHDLIENPIVVFKPTTEDSPVDLVEGENTMHQVDADPHYKNLLVQSIAYCKHHKVQIEDSNLTEDALELFRSKKVIVISGPRGSGKTTLALSLLSSYQEGHYLILTEPEDLNYIRFGITCVVVVEDLGGKYTLEMSAIHKWLRKFDLLYSAVKDGKLNVIITCVSDRLHACGNVDSSKHPILDSVLHLSKSCAVKIKKEPSEDEPTGIRVLNGMRNVDTAKFTRVKKIDEIEIEFPHPVQPEEYTGFCQHPDGSFIVIGTYFDVNTNTESRMMCHVKSDLQYISHYDISHICTNNVYVLRKICCTDSGDVVIENKYNTVSIYKITDGTLHIMESTEICNSLENISFHRKRIYCQCYYSQLYMLDTNLNVKKKVKLPSSSMGTGLVVPCLMQKYFYINRDAVNIICYDPKQKQIRYLGKEGFEPVCICAASDDSVFVLGRQDFEDNRILLLNTDMEILSDISVDKMDITWSVYNISKLEFDKVSARLIVQTGHKRFIQIYLE